MIKFRKPRSTWFDRLSLYRYVGILLSPLFVHSTYRALTESYPFSWRVIVFWAANILLFYALGKDAWQVFKAKREIREAINGVVEKDDPIV
jgi:hypothetical protein